MGLIKNYFDKLFKRKNLTTQPNMGYYSAGYVYVEGLSARDLYSSQANLHAVVSFLSDSVAQLPLKVYERKDETTRIRNRDSIIAKVLYRPNRDQTSYEFINALTIEYLLYGEAIILVLNDDSEVGYQLRIIPQEWVEKRLYDNNFAPTALFIKANGESRVVKITSDQFVIFKMYSPGSPALYQSPIKSLKQTLSEQIQAADFRLQNWLNGGRTNSFITRPKDTPWESPQARDAWNEQWKGFQSGGQRRGAIPVLEDGMDWKSIQFSAKEAQYVESIQLTREDVAAAYHVNPSLIWHTNTQTYASAKDNARSLYADCLGPMLQMFQQRFNSFLLPMIDTTKNLYVEFDLEEKLKGSFEERASIMQSATGAPWLTRNEVRAEYNLAPIEGGDKLIIPLNVLVGGQASPQDSTPDSYSNMYASSDPKVKDVENLQRHGSINLDTRPSDEVVEKFQSVIEKFLKRQKASISTKLKAVENWWDAERWNTELANDLYPILMSVSEELGRKIANELKSVYYSGNTKKYLRLLAETKAAYINDNTYEAIMKSQAEEDVSIDDVFDGRLLMAATIAEGLSDTVEDFATRETISQAEYQGVISKPKVTKTWHTGDNPRPSHAAMDGETVDYDDTFSNGLRWPHDFGEADEVAGCNCWCSVEITF